MVLSKQTEIKWASYEDMISNYDFVTERIQKLDSMKNENLTDSVILSDIENFIGQIKFVDETSAILWIDFVTQLAEKYSKTIVSTSVTTI